MTDHRDCFLLNFNRFFCELEGRNLVPPGTHERFKNDGEARRYMKKERSAVNKAMIDALKDHPEFFFNLGDYKPSSEYTRSKCKYYVGKLLDTWKNNKTHSLRCLFEKRKRQAKRQAEQTLSQIQLSQTHLGSDSEDNEEDPIPSPPPVKRRLRSSDAHEPSTSGLNSSTTTSQFEASASETFSFIDAPFDTLEKAKLDLRGHSTVKGSLAAHLWIFGLLARGMDSAGAHMSLQRFCEVTTELQDAQVMSEPTISRKRFCLPTLNRLQIVELLKKSGKGILLLDDASMLHSTKTTGLVYVSTTGESFVLKYFPTFESKAEGKAKETLEHLRDLPFWDILKDRIAFTMSDSSYTQAAANKLIIASLKETENIDVYPLYCLMHSVAILEKNTYDLWDKEKKNPHPALKKARQIQKSLMTVFGASNKSLESQHSKSLREHLDECQSLWYNTCIRLFHQDLGCRYATVSLNVRALLFHLPLVNRVLDEAGQSNNESKFLADVVHPLFTPNHKDTAESQFIVSIAGITPLLFFGSLKRFHSKISPTILTLGEVMDELVILDNFFKSVLGNGKKGAFERLLKECEAKCEEEQKLETIGMCKTLRDFHNRMNSSSKAKLDEFTFDSLTRSQKKHLTELNKWLEVEKQVPRETVLTATSRNVERSFGTLKAFERKYWAVEVRRLYIIAQSQFNKVTEWMDGLKRSDPEELERAFALSLYERKKNEKEVQLGRLADRKKLTKIVPRDGEDEFVRNLQELNRNEDADPEEFDESEGEELVPEQNNLEDDLEAARVLDAEMNEIDFEKSVEN